MEQKLREAEVFGLNHKFAVNAAQCDIANPVPSDLFPVASAQERTRQLGDKIVTKFTVPEPFELQTQQRDLARRAKKTSADFKLTAHNFAPASANVKTPENVFPTEPDVKQTNHVLLTFPQDMSEFEMYTNS